MADTRVLPVSNVKYGLKAETAFGVAIDSSGADGTAYLTQPVVQVQKPTFNILRESRLLSGRGSVKNAADTIVNLRGGSNVTPNHAIGNTINVHVNGRVGASDQELRDIARRVGSMINREINRTTTKKEAK